VAGRQAAGRFRKAEVGAEVVSFIFDKYLSAIFEQGKRSTAGKDKIYFKIGHLLKM
jgi:hypothetical protein